jgi:hypothetical protein
MVRRSWAIRLLRLLRLLPPDQGRRAREVRSLLGRELLHARRPALLAAFLAMLPEEFERRGRQRSYARGRRTVA